MLGWTTMDLARIARISVSMIKRLEGPECQRASDEGLSMILGAMTTAGVSFLADDGEGQGIRLSASLPEPEAVLDHRKSPGRCRPGEAALSWGGVTSPRAK